MRISNTCNSKTTNKCYIVISFVAWLFSKFCPCNEYGGSRGLGGGFVTQRPSWLDGLIKRCNRGEWWNAKSRCLLALIFAFFHLSLSPRDTVTSFSLFRNILHFKSDVWLAPPAALLIEMSFGCAAGGPGQGRTQLCRFQLVGISCWSHFAVWANDLLAVVGNANKVMWGRVWALQMNIEHAGVCYKGTAVLVSSVVSKAK